jgi:hypothetical protein
MAALDGHLAFIAPNYARGTIGLEDLGGHVFHPDGWTSHFGPDVATVLTLTPARPPRTLWTARLRALTARVRGALQRRRTP